MNKRRIVLKNIDDEIKQVHIMENTVVATDIVRNFLYFMQGMSFTTSTIVRAFQDIAEEYTVHESTDTDDNWPSPSHE